MPAAPTFYLWINGEAREGRSTFEVHNPYDGSTVATVALAGRRQIREAIQGARAAFPELKQMPRFERARLLERMVDGFHDAKPEIIDALILEGVKPRMFAEQEWARTVAVFSWAAGEARRFCGEIIPVDGMERGKNYEGYVLRNPIGPVLGI